MNKKEQILAEILQKSLIEHQFEFTQMAIAGKMGVSLSTVFNALKIPRSQGAIKVGGRAFRVVDAEKLLYILATQRNVEKDIIYRTRVDDSAPGIEGLMPAGAAFSAYSAYRHKYSDAPADYDKVYVYADDLVLGEIKKRFPRQAGEANLFVLKPDPGSGKAGSIAPETRVFCDLWNLPDWYAKDFLKALKEKLGLI